MITLEFQTSNFLSVHYSPCDIDLDLITGKMQVTGLTYQNYYLYFVNPLGIHDPETVKAKYIYCLLSGSQFDSQYKTKRTAHLNSPGVT